MAGTPDDPTRRLSPTPPPESVREVEVVEGDPALLEDLRSLKRAVALLGVLSVLALGVALWALLQGDGEDDQGPRGASVSSVNDLRERVDDLEGDVENAATDSSVSKLRSDVESLGEQVDEVAQEAEQAGDQGDAADVADELGTRVDDLEGRVDELEAQADADAGGGGTDTP
jgi:methyl-accepting chemotaxis protein